ncbi:MULTISPECIES: GNAT family N-acetyltransferase [Staphylococcus]|uniref:GNAT family N-acetyltransferase n=1 Tax=Staphylococcus TaxID=1279 RepID=UPI00024641CD|nr:MULTISPECIES: GNAT family N-acetyltransferase [Staphylococcus]QAV30672.1 N-acetyltransferase [Sulfitobacter donghicola]AGZ25518.1 GNAT family acetyltransferase [Staphylococcus pasteuri SP1]KAB7644224.1 GNAT family N-acetyltransferase [Staphylococcus sp. B2-b]MBN6853355.1 GNAT family N-acetyltransferase [Staphylococcus warneri]MBT2770115.1 GNAT family N-acetyltransferase [Staphylococcus warneri]
MQYITSKHIPIEELRLIYNDVGWFNYTYDLNKLSQAFHHSLYVLSVWDDTELIGLIRLVGDGISVIIIQDLLVKRQYQNHGIGSKLLGEVLSQFDHTMQIVCMTDDQESTKSFYKKHDLKPVTKYNIVGMANIKSHI